MRPPFPVADPGRTLLAVDFDGTLSPIVRDPVSAFALPESLAALLRLAGVLGRVAIVTGRPVAEVRRLGRFDETGTPAGLVVVGQYGAERWDSVSGQLHEPEPGQVLRDFVAELPALLDSWGAAAARIEDKRIAVAVHTRGLGPEVAEALTGPLAREAGTRGLVLEPGRQVVEVRPPGTDKGRALAGLVADEGVTSVVWAGDDLGDLPAFAELRRLAAVGLETLGIAVTSAEAPVELREVADAVVEGPESFAVWLAEWADHLGC